jgi:hypothetical protein
MGCANIGIEIPRASAILTSVRASTPGMTMTDTVHRTPSEDPDVDSNGIFTAFSAEVSGVQVTRIRAHPP